MFWEPFWWSPATFLFLHLVHKWPTNPYFSTKPHLVHLKKKTNRYGFTRQVPQPRPQSCLFIERNVTLVLNRLQGFRRLVVVGQKLFVKEALGATGASWWTPQSCWVGAFSPNIEPFFTLEICISFNHWSLQQPQSFWFIISPYWFIIKIQPYYTINPGLIKKEPKQSFHLDFLYFKTFCVFA